MKLALLGTGMIIHMALPSLNEMGIEKKAIFSTPRSREKAEKIAAENNIEQVFTDYDALLESDIDTVYVGLPNALHYDFAAKALKAGKHVILEKPAVTTAAKMEELMALAKENNVILAEAVTLHYMPAFLKLKEALPKAGRLRLFVFNFSQYSSRYDRFKAGDIAPAFDPACAGGAFMDLNVYNINAAFGLFGVPQTMTYSANMDRNIDTSGICSLLYEDFQGVCIGAKDCAAPGMSTIQGDKATLVIHGNLSTMTSFSIEYHDGSREEVSIEHPKDRMYYEFETFHKWIEEGSRKEANAMMELSLSIVKAMEQARKDAGIYFPDDAAA